jgi:hypothetical protein
MTIFLLFNFVASFCTHFEYCLQTYKLIEKFDLVEASA